MTLRPSTESQVRVCCHFQWMERRGSARLGGRKKTTTKRNTKTKTMTKKTLNTFREHLQSLRLLTFKTFDQGDEKAKRQ